jgi:hypothetical protein
MNLLMVIGLYGGIKMVNTNRIKTEIEPAVRNWLKTEIGDVTLEERPMNFPSGGSYKFDAVSRDGRIVAAILCNRAKTRTGRENTGGVRKALAEVEHLKLLPGNISKMMVFTDSDFSNLVQRRASRFGITNIRFLVCPLPADKKMLLNNILDEASQEQRAAE